MLNQRSIDAVNASVWGKAARFRKPLYDSYCFSRIPATVEYVLTGDETAKSRALPPDVLGGELGRYKKVVLLFVDAFGWKLFDRHKERFPLLRRFVEKGTASKLTSQFPSTTSAHVTSIHTGMPVFESGVFEWYYYDPAADDVITPLLFSYAGDKQRDTLLPSGLTAADILPSPTLYQRLAGAGVRSTVFQFKNYTPSTFSDHMFEGAEIVPYSTLPEALSILGSKLTSDQGPSYYFLYADSVDVLCHQLSIDSEQVQSEAEGVCLLIEELLCKKMEGKLDDTLLLMTADHGHMAMQPEKTHYVNQLMPELPSLLKRNKQGNILRFGGNRRDLCLYVQDPHVDEVVRGLASALEGVAEVYPMQELIDAGLFGPAQSKRLMDRLGNVMILPYEGEAVFWFEDGKFVNKERGSHGGLSAQEMETGLYAVTL